MTFAFIYLRTALNFDRIIKKQVIDSKKMLTALFLVTLVVFGILLAFVCVLEYRRVLNGADAHNTLPILL